jgi:hypothetical protein
MGSKPRRYPVGGDLAPEKVEVTKTEIFAALEAGTRVRSKREILVLCARAHATMDASRAFTVDELSWARKIIDVPAAERLLDKMVKDAQVVSRLGGEWLSLGIGSLPANGVYYTTPERAEKVDQRAQERRDAKRLKAAQERATKALTLEYSERFLELVTQYLGAGDEEIS